MRFARTTRDLDAALRLRFEVFNLELGEGLAASWETGRDADPFDPICHHLLVEDGERLVGTYRLQTAAMAAAHRGFYSAGEFDLSALPPEVTARSVELGRACVARGHRSTRVLFLLWKGLALYVAANRCRYLFGCSSLTSQDPDAGKALMDRLTAEGHLHPTIRVPPLPELACYPERYAARPGTPADLPTLFRTYLRHGAKVCGPPAIDREFRTIDYFVLFDVEGMSPAMRRTFFG